MPELPDHFKLPAMTGAEAKAVRNRLGLSAAQMALVFDHKDRDDLGRTVRRWEQVGPSKAVTLALHYLQSLQIR